MIAPTSVLKTRPDVRYRLVDGKGILIRQGIGEVLVLNRVGARLLDMLQTGLPVQGVLEAMLGEFEVEHAELERDALAFIEQLMDSAILEEASGR